MSFPDWVPDLALARAPELLVFAFLVHTGALICLWSSASPGVVMVLGTVVVLFSFYFALEKYRKRDLQIVRLRCLLPSDHSEFGEDNSRCQWHLYYGDGRKFEGILDSSSVIKHGFLFLVFRSADEQKKLVLTRRSMTPNEWRRLRVGLLTGQYL